MRLPLFFISDCHIGMKLDSDELERRRKLFKLFDNIKEKHGKFRCLKRHALVMTFGFSMNRKFEIKRTVKFKRFMIPR